MIIHPTGLVGEKEFVRQAHEQIRPTWRRTERTEVVFIRGSMPPQSWRCSRGKGRPLLLCLTRLLFCVSARRLCPDTWSTQVGPSFPPTVAGAAPIRDNLHDAMRSDFSEPDCQSRPSCTPRDRSFSATP